MKKLIAVLMLCFIVLVVPSCLPTETNGVSQAVIEAYRDGYNSGVSEGYSQCQDSLPQYDIALNYPTRDEVEAFLAQDDTDNITYDWKTFVCTDYAQRVNNNAWEVGIPCSAIWITWEGNILSGHAIVAFPVRENDKIILLYNDPEVGDELYGEDVIAVGKPYIISTCSSTTSLCSFKIIGRIREYK